jgi:hypothetical protein
VSSTPDADPDYVGLAFGALAMSAALGLALNAAVGFVVRTLQTAEQAAQRLDIGAPTAVVLFAGTFLACFAAAIATWRVMAPVRNTFRQGMLAMVSFFASFVLSVVTMPVDRAFGRTGLVLLSLSALTLAIVLNRRIARAFNSL